MPDIQHDLPIAATPARVFEGIATPDGLDHWWTLASSGHPELGAEYELGFGPGCDWKGTVRRCEPDRAFELELTVADDDWLGSRVGFELEAGDGVTQVRFYHRGWPEENGHYRVSCFCWAMYLRVLKRWIEFGETVPYERRLDV